MAMNMHEPFGGCDSYGQSVARRGQSRRQVLGLGLAGVLTWASTSALGQVALQAPDRHGNVVVVVFLRGGWDALNVVAPYAEEHYYRARPGLALARPASGEPEARKLKDLDGFFGLNPALLPLWPAWESGEVAFVHAIGSGDQTHSHFEAMATMEAGARRQASEADGGWLTRHLQSAGESWPLRAVAWGGMVPDSLGGYSSAVGVNSLAEYRLTEPALLSRLEAMYGASTDEVGQAGQAILSVLRKFESVDPKDYRPERGATYPDSELGRALRETAFLIKKDVGLEIACMDSNGWDSHVTQGTTDGWLWTLLRDLADSLAAFRRDLGPEMKRVTVIVQSEFGRRLYENSGLGTDHGEGGAMMLMGAGVRGGKVYGRWPGIDPEIAPWPGLLKVTTDYRDVLADVVAQRLKNPQVNSVFPGRPGRSLGVIQAG